MQSKAEQGKGIEAAAEVITWHREPSEPQVAATAARQPAGINVNRLDGLK